MIKLVYIRGISAYDTPYFSTKAKQDLFFDNLDGVEIEAYYPPHFTNAIKFDVDDVSDITQYNYLILYTERKTYYYFLGNLRYINEDDYYVDIEMDTAQTYMFDIVWNESLVTRMSINRWKTNSINRDYIRENLSQTSKKLSSYNELDIMDFFILQSSYNYTFDTNAYTQGAVANNRLIANGCYYYLIPIPKFHSQYIRVRNYYNENQYNQYDIIGSQAFLEELLDTLVKDPYTLNLYYVKNLHMSSLIDIDMYRDETDPLMTHIDLKYSNKISFYNDMSYAGCIGIPNDYTQPTNRTYMCAFLIRQFNSEWQSYANDISIKFGNDVISKNTSIGVTFDKKYIPQLIDENYIELAFGERMTSTNFPLHYSSTNLFTLQNVYDIFSGFRSYKIVEKNQDDVYLTTTIIATLETLDLYNDAWETYQAQHKGDLTIGIKNSIAKNIYSGVSQVASSFGTRNSRSTFFDESGTGVASFGSYTASSNRLKAVKGVTDMIVANASVQAELWQLQDNMESTPDTSRCGNEFYSDYINNSINTVYTIMVSEDIESVARKMEYHGYKVCEYIRGNLFEECKKRYYYNVVQVDNMYIDLSILTTADILFNLKSRFMNGLRLWDMEHNTYITEGLKYDNVELEVL